MSCVQWFCFLYITGTRSAAFSSTSCAGSVNQIEEQEHREASTTKVELLQRHRGSQPQGRPAASSAELEAANDLEAYGGFHRYLLVRPCERFAGDGRSGLPRHLVTGECCGDAICSPARFETFESCPHDCTEEPKETSMLGNQSRKVLPPTQCTLFGELEGMEHDEYHCEDLYDEDGGSLCSSDINRSSRWLEDLLERQKNGTLPFDLPGPGSVAVEMGAGRGQDSRNMATLAGYAVTAVEVSPTAVEIAKEATLPEMLGNGTGQVEFVAYDATALPVPKKRVDFMFDATVYCGMRHLYLIKFYDVWSRIATPGHTLINIQCWNEESFYYAAVPHTRRDMEADFEPVFDVLHSEECSKNQGRTGWCFYMKLKAPEVRSKSLADRLSMQLAVRNGDIEVVRQKLDKLSGNIDSAELMTLYYIALSNWHKPLIEYLRSMMQEQDDPFQSIVYGDVSEAETIKAEDQRDGGESNIERLVLKFMKTDWERAESQIILRDEIKMFLLANGISSNDTLGEAHEYLSSLGYNLTKKA